MSKFRSACAVAAVSLISTVFLACSGGSDSPENTPAATVPSGQTAPATRAASVTNATSPTVATTATTAPTTPAPAATPLATLPAGRSTGNPELDNIAALASANWTSVDAAFEFTAAACSTVAGGAPQCKAGEANGKLIEVVPYAACEAGYLRLEDLQAILTKDIPTGPLHSAFTLTSSDADYFGAPNGLLFETTRDGAPAAVLFAVTDDGVITGVSTACQMTAALVFESSKGEKVLVAPQ